MGSRLRSETIRLLRWSEKYTKTDMVYLVTSGLWINLNFAFVAILSFLLSIAFANLLAKSEYGTYQYVLSVSSILVAFTFTGFNTTITQSVARGFDGTLRASIRPQLLWNLVPTTVALGLSGYYFLHRQTELGIGILFVAISLPLLNTFNSYLAYLAGKQNFKYYALYSIACNAAYYICIFLCIFFFPQALPLILVNLFITTAGAIFFYYQTLHTFKAQGQADPEALPYAQHLSVMNVLSTVAGQIDNLLVFHFLGATDLAVYSIASLLPERLGSALQSFSSTAFPRFAGRSMTDIKKNLAPRLAMYGFMIVIGALCYALVAPFAFHLIYPAYDAAIPYSQLYAFTALNYVGSLALSVLSAHRKVRRLYAFNLGVPITQIALQVVAILNWGLFGLVIAKIASSLVASAASIAFIYVGEASDTVPHTAL